MDYFSLLKIEAWSVPSTFIVQGSGHCLVVSEDKSLGRDFDWGNAGRCFADLTESERASSSIVATNLAYKEWLTDFCPSKNISKCGVQFSVNGVCQTFAAREMLVGCYDANVRDALMNHICTVWFGKYGYGLNQLKTLLTESYRRVTTGRNDQFNALEKVLARVDNYIDDEFYSWFLFLRDNVKAPMDKIMGRTPNISVPLAKNLLQQIVDYRENTYQQYLNNEINREDLVKAIKGKILEIVAQGFDIAVTYNYISSEEKIKFVETVKSFLDLFNVQLEEEEAVLRANGLI